MRLAMTSTLLTLCIFSLTATALFSVNLAQAGSMPPKQKLAVTFDLEKNTMLATSTIEFPPDTEGKYHMDTLDVVKVIINNQEIDLADKSRKLFADKDHPLTIAPSPTGTVVAVVYTKKIPENTRSASDLISSGGITLTGVWHPILHQDMLFELTAEIPASFTAVSEAEEIVSTKTTNGNNLVRFKFDQAVPTINFIAGPYEVETTTFGDNQELYTYFFKEDAELAPSYQQKTLNYLERYIKLIGPYPYKRFSVVENRLPSGFAMPTFTMLGQAVVRLPFITDTSLGHEVLHEWFGNSVKIDSSTGNWAEGLTTYLADQQFAAERGENVDFRKNQLIKYQSYVPHNNNIAVKHFLGSSSHTDIGQKAVRAVGYSKTSMIFHMLKTAIGADKFNQALRNFYAEMKFKRAGWENIAASFEKVTHAKMDVFFDQWLDRPDIPVLMLDRLRTNEEEGIPVLSFVIKQPATNPYEIDVPVSVYTGGEKITRLITLTQKETPVEIPFENLPRELVIDENYDLMRRLADSELPPVWSRFEGAAKKLAVIGSKEKQDIYQPLMQLLATMNCEMKPAAELTDKEVAQGSVIFLGASSDLARTIFAGPDHPAGGFTVDIRKNPLNPSSVAVLVSAENSEEVLRAARKLTHYGKYSYLHFDKGRIKEKHITPTDSGQRYVLDTPPKGIEIKENLSFDRIMEKLADNRVVYIGESHTRYEDHLLQLRVIRGMYAQNPNLAIGMEMFNRPTHEVLDKYISGEIDEPTFLAESHYFSKWGFDYRLYQPIINFARQNRIPIIPLNLEKEIVSKVYRETGLSGLEEEQKAILPDERDLDLPEYRERIATVFRMHGTARHADNEQLNNFLQAQALWDETMAESIAEYLIAKPEMRMAVIAGRGHVDKQNAIPPRVKRRIDVKQSVILNVEQLEVDEKTADFLFFSAPAQLPPPVLMGVMLKNTDNGVIIEKLSPHGNAKKVGIKKNDLFIAMDGRPVKTIEDIKLLMFPKKKGDKVPVKLKRIRKFWPDSELEIEIPL